MAKKLYEESDVQAIAHAIRAKSGKNETFRLSEMAGAVDRIAQGNVQAQWHQCPEPVQSYLDGVSYDPDDYSVSLIDKYAPSAAVLSSTRPIGKVVDGVTYFNEVPNQETPFSSANTAGTVKPLDRLRWLNTPSAVNVRDLGGWACDGGTVRYGLLFRGGEVSAADRDVLVGECGVRHDLNLRGASEATWTESPLGSDIRFTKADDYNWYAATVNVAWKVNLRCVFDAVAHNEPVYFHCAAGADRTGTLACVLEGLLGVSQSDIDKDYELTCFYSGTGSDAAARRRNESDWTGLIEQINAFDGSTFRDKCVTFAAMLGFTAEEINAFRAAMIDGTPETVTPAIASFSVAKTLTHARTDSSAVSAVQYQPYTANVSPEDGYVLSDIAVKMGGVDITSKVFSGEKTNREFKVTATLVNCSGNNAKQSVIAGQSYGVSMTADSGYTLDGAAVTIKMGGIEVSEQYYAGGIIAIPNVTGDIEITITAVQTAEDNFIVFDDCYAVVDSASGTAMDSGHAEKDISNHIFVTHSNRGVYGNVMWTSEALKALPAGKYCFSGEFKQDAADASAIAIFNGTTRMFKNSLNVGNVWTAFSYEFELTAAGVIGFMAINDSAAGGDAYLRNAKIRNAY